MITCACGSTHIKFIVIRSGVYGRRIVRCSTCGKHSSLNGRLYSA